MQQATSAAEAIAVLKRDPWRFDLLISDVARGEDRLAGFNELPQIREQADYGGPVIFFVRAVRAEDREASQALEALITNDPLELYEMASQFGEIVARAKAETTKFKSSLHHKMYGLPTPRSALQDCLKA